MRNPTGSIKLPDNAAFGVRPQGSAVDPSPADDHVNFEFRKNFRRSSDMPESACTVAVSWPVPELPAMDSHDSYIAS
jgi:hypothetical protein